MANDNLILGKIRPLLHIRNHWCWKWRRDCTPWRSCEVGPHVKPGLKTEFELFQKSETDKAKVNFELVLSENQFWLQD